MSVSRKAKICYDLMSQTLEILEKNDKIADNGVFELVQANMGVLGDILKDGSIEETDDLDESITALLRQNVNIFFQVIDGCQKEKRMMTKEEIVKMMQDSFNDDNSNIREMSVGDWLEENNIVLKQESQSLQDDRK